MFCNNDNNNLRRPLMFQVDSINEDKRIIERNKMLVDKPIGGSFKVSNGKYLCEIDMCEYGVRVKCTDKSGRVETIATKTMSG
ncbi:MAG: hypothetical protein ABIG84_07440 [archaeon]